MDEDPRLQKVKERVEDGRLPGPSVDVGTPATTLQESHDEGRICAVCDVLITGKHMEIPRYENSRTGIRINLHFHQECAEAWRTCTGH